MPAGTITMAAETSSGAHASMTSATEVRHRTVGSGNGVVPSG